MVARLHRGDTLPDFQHDASALMPQHAGKEAFRILARQGEGVGMAYAGMADLDQHLARLRRGDVDLDDFERLSGTEGNGGAGFHDAVSIHWLHLLAV